MVLESFSASLRETIRKITGSSYIDKETVKEISKDLQRILLKADVNVKTVLQVTKEMERRALEEKPPAGMAHQDYMVRIIYEELLKILGEPSNVKLKPQTIMLVGLYGNGKTTTAGKLARFFAKKGLNSGLIAADVHRYAAYDQLKQIASEVNAKFYGDQSEKDPVRLIKHGLEQLKDVAVKIIDTSGRDSMDAELFDEIRRIKEAVAPDEVLMIIDATMGQQAGPEAKAFNDAIGVTGIIITKMDGTAKGGGALSAVAEIHVPIYFIGTGEHMDDLEVFDPKKFLSRLLGLGDLESLFETVQEADITEEEAQESFEKLMTGKFNLKDMYDVWEKFSKPGLMKKLVDALPLARIPGSQKIDDSKIQSAEDKLRMYRIIMDSMTFEELENPEIINAKRITRIARGAGVREEDVRMLLKEFKAMKNNMKMMKGNRGLKKMLQANFRSGNFGLEDLGIKE
ncbi:probable signal recognition particle protein [Thermoplasma acidophilum]|uniref:Signal recognition particle 54 kDa protein n=1 Tax=Thermoplasma acidophilum (strain ATCC 25905 / DSM 1728 / JCM 9062 / NBRC 15155 / AMRC-C165) TaxID=273075 RepID=SRP54_THEAC|nr:signal recognition particle protein Srp54 [Thermoplasma acidophilum]Q9HKT0.1 RecName: Full=Signal recognition particle 54 kDa protein; Short=SRP54 [Thermoplasma acidophilum DSM 1728]MCY0852388.1 signal recognition particle protein Srp54 [Thermoplasma acidophilum]CAC11655.1 probable signal recognition particle protein [Thermoplasma acidophilum]